MAGIASSISEMFREAGLSTPIHSIGIPLEFIEHSKRAEIHERSWNYRTAASREVFHGIDPSTSNLEIRLWKRCNTRRMKTLTANRIANSFAI